MNKFILILLFSVVGILILDKGLERYKSVTVFLSQSSRIQGEIAYFAEEKFIPVITADLKIFYPVVRFNDPNGETSTVKGKFGSRWKFSEQGQKTYIYFNPQYPDDPVIDSFREVWLTAYTLIALGALLLIVGLWLGVRSAKSKDLR